MNWVDGIVIGVLLLSGIVALLRGFVRELLGIIAWSAAAFLALAIGPMLVEPVGRVIHDQTWAQIVAYASLFIITLVVLSIIAGAVADVVRNSFLAPFDRLLGGIYGVARGLALLVIACIVLTKALSPQEWPQPIQNARTLPKIEQLATWSEGYIPERYRHYLALDRGDDKLPSVDEPALPLPNGIGPDGQLPVPDMTPHGPNVVPMPDSPPANPAGR